MLKITRQSRVFNILQVLLAQCMQDAERIFFLKKESLSYVFKCGELRMDAPFHIKSLDWSDWKSRQRAEIPRRPHRGAKKKNQDKESIEFFSKVVHAEWGEDLRRRKFQDESTSWGGRLVVLPCSLSLSHRNATWLWRRNCEKEKNARYQFEWRTIRVEGEEVSRRNNNSVVYTSHAGAHADVTSLTVRKQRGGSSGNLNRKLGEDRAEFALDPRRRCHRSALRN